MDGDNLTAYELHEQIGAGGMGTVYRATDRRIGRTVAIKMIRPDSLLAEGVRDRFVREARTIGGLNHPNIATLYDVSLTGDRPFIVMEYLPAGSLHERLGQGPMPLLTTLRWAAGIAGGLEHAHANGVIHRDLKPANILFSADGLPKIIDFGLASLPESPAVTVPGTVVGTASYMSPEQARGDPVDRRSDIFSFGVIVYLMASGRHPFQRDSVPATLHRIVYDQPPPLSTIRPGLPSAFNRLVNGLLEKSLENRTQNLRGVITELNVIEQSTSGTAAATETMLLPPESVKSGPRRPLRWVAAAVAILAVVAGLGWWVRTRMASALPASRELVVLPFENLSRDPMEQAFCDGLLELVTSSLTQMERFQRTLWVIPSADVRRLQLHSVGDARKVFPVNLAVTGSLQTDGDQVLVIVNLSDATTTRQIGSRIIPLTRAERGQLTARLVSALLELLELGAGKSSGDVLRGAQPQVPSANDSYLQGKGFLLHIEVPANLERAIELLEQSVQLDPNFALSRAALADAYLRRYSRTKDQEWLAKADQMAQRGLELDGTQAAVHLTAGRLYRATGQASQAIAEIQKAIALDPLDVAGYTTLALAYSDARRPADAEKAYQQAIQLRPSYWPAYSNLGIFYELRGEYAKALNPLSLVVKLAPEYADGHDNLGTLYYSKERFDDALKEFARSLEIHPTAFAYSNRGGIYFAQGDYAKAREAFRHARELEDKDPLFWGNLADADMQIPDARAEAADAYRRAIALSRERLAVNPKDADVLGRMSFYLAQTSNCGEALARIEEARKLAPDRVTLVYKSAKVAEACHDRTSALRYLESAIRKGYSRREIERDPDFSQLRQTPAYAAMRARTVESKQ